MIAACTPDGGPGASFSLPFLPSSRQGAYLLAGPDATATPTPFQPIPPTLAAPLLQQTLDAFQQLNQGALITPDPNLELGLNLGATGEPDYSVAYMPPPVEKLKIPTEVETMVFLGTDEESPNIGRTDTMILVFINQKTSKVSLVSVPRDLFVYLRDWSMQRINTAFVMGGIDLLFNTLEYNLGVRPTKWVLIHFDDFFHFINDIGGLDIPVREDHPFECGGLYAGIVHMDGGQTLCYVRIRANTDDFDRSRRQQEVLRVLLRRVMSIDVVTQLPKYYNRYSQTAQTNLSLAEVVAHVPLAIQLKDGDGLYQFQINHEYVFDYMDPYWGMMVLLPNRAKIMPLLQYAVDVVSMKGSAPQPPSPAE